MSPGEELRSASKDKDDHARHRPPAAPGTCHRARAQPGDRTARPPDTRSGESRGFREGEAWIALGKGGFEAAIPRRAGRPTAGQGPQLHSTARNAISLPSPWELRPVS